MDKSFNKGFAFILEGDTEREFYFSFLEFLCQKHGATLSRTINKSDPDINYVLKTEDGASLIKFKVANTITQVPHTGKWFNSQCVGKYDSGMDWYVFLCYDKDDYKEDISKFYEGDWMFLRKSLKKAKQIIDVAAAADIEDVMLQDNKNICHFIGCEPPVTLKGKKGKAKLKNLFREHGRCYHAGKRAKDLIHALDMNALIEGGLVPLKEIERLLFG